MLKGISSTISIRIAKNSCFLRTHIYAWIKMPPFVTGMGNGFIGCFWELEFLKHRFFFLLNTLPINVTKMQLDKILHSILINKDVDIEPRKARLNISASTYISE